MQKLGKVNFIITAVYYSLTGFLHQTIVIVVWRVVILGNQLDTLLFNVGNAWDEHKGVLLQVVLTSESAIKDN